MEMRCSYCDSEFIDCLRYSIMHVIDYSSESWQSTLMVSQANSSSIVLDKKQEYESYELSIVLLGHDIFFCITHLRSVVRQIRKDLFM
jgi:hypothetical protein